MSVSISDESGQETVSAEGLAELTDLVAFLYAQMHLGREVELAVTLCDESRMEQLHQEWMSLPGATDVMSFPMDELSPGLPGHVVEIGTLGDIVLCPTVAAAQAEAHGHSVLDELCLLTVHGVLHLLGYEHDTPEARSEMFHLQRVLLEDFLGRDAPVPTESDPGSA
ncbi:rRNA maturation RNase YbeY [Nesterenkonia pannonica]|uniref:rRNA maturation RNase YbeY n=1 Tax=Nesterenkonia pannonica TaxID=1548602 RepID=UPI0021648FB5|nr:rRNA maturation RNase YbeY [Nesterenkonia pannonica]